MGEGDEATFVIDEVIEKAEEDFAKDDFRSASAGWEAAYNSEDLVDDPDLKKDLAWNIGLAEALQNNVERSQWYFAASEYGRDYFQERGVDAVYVQIMLGGQEGTD
jgi:hypothetical protein